MVDEISVLFIDDEKILCETISDDLEEEGFKVTTATDGSTAIRNLKKHNYDIVVTDLVMEGMNGIQITREIEKIKPDIPVIILTGHGSMESAIEAVQLGVSDYLLKPIDRVNLIGKIRCCLDKNSKSRQILPHSPAFNLNLDLQEASLTRREMEVAKLASEGYSDTEISRTLSISPYTVKFHLKKVFKKLNIHKRVELILSLSKKP